MTEQTSINVEFSGTSGDPADRKLSIEVENGLALYPTIRLRVYPADVERFAVSSGTLTREDNGERPVIESLQFNGTDFVELEYWTRSAPEILYQETFFDDEGKDIAVRFSWDADRCGLRASAAVYAVVQVAYLAPFARYRYLFETDPARPAMGIAIERNRSAVLDLQLPEAGADDKYVELYRVTSQIVTDPEGTWEFPENFPDESSYPGGQAGPDTGTYMISERTHEAAVIRPDGSIDERRLFIAWERPYTGAFYDPKWRMQRGSPPAGYEKLWLDVDWTGIEEALAKRYPDIEL